MAMNTLKQLKKRIEKFKNNTRGLTSPKRAHHKENLQSKTRLPSKGNRDLVHQGRGRAMTAQTSLTYERETKNSIDKQIKGILYIVEVIFTSLNVFAMSTSCHYICQSQWKYYTSNPTFLPWNNITLFCIQNSYIIFFMVGLVNKIMFVSLQKKLLN